jgi:fermentation-respiration switch protein FrsA (DUF1100 family)
MVSTSETIEGVPRWVILGFGGLLAVVLLVVTLAYLFQRSLVFLPSDGPVPSAGDVLPGARDVTLTTSDGLELGAWFVPALGTERGTVLVAPGNAGDRSLRAPLAAALRERGLSVLLFDYRGFGGNPGDPTEEGLALDVRAAREYLLEDRDRLIYFGESLGAGVVTELATEHPPAGLVLRSPFTELSAVAQEHYPFLPTKLLLKDRFPVVENVARISVPTAVVYGSADSIVPAEQSRAVADAAAGPVERVEVRDADHNDAVLLDGPQVIDAVAELALGTDP